MTFAFSRTRIIPCAAKPPPDEAEMHQKLVAEGMEPVRWESAAFESFAAHAHSFDKVLYVVSGELILGLPQEGGQVRLRPGDRLELAAYTIHDAIAGPFGVVCLEGHRTVGRDS
jgi:quercetin dioxygenase-like cupin family protein